MNITPKSDRTSQAPAFDWRDFGESVYFLFGERGLKERIHFVRLRYPGRAGPIVEAMIEGAKEAGRELGSQ